MTVISSNPSFALALLDLPAAQGVYAVKFLLDGVAFAEAEMMPGFAAYWSRPPAPPTRSADARAATEQVLFLLDRTNFSRLPSTLTHYDVADLPTNVLRKVEAKARRYRARLRHSP